MRLPDFLSEADGEVRLAGHRIGLVHVVKAYNDGHSAEMIAAEFPTLPLAMVHKVIAFYLDNQADVDSYVAVHDREMAALERQSRPAGSTPTVAELRRRLESIRRAGPA